MIARPRVPAFLRLIRVFNAAGGALARAGVTRPRLEAEDVIEAARRQVRLDDFGTPEWREPLEIVLAGLRGEAQLTPLGRIAARGDLVSLLATRLRLEADRRRNPAIAAEEIRRPLFIVGLPRTGSTLLHHLLAHDPAARVAQAWEVMFPSPPPERASYLSDPRIPRAAARLRWLDRLAPEFKTIHPLGAQLALECIALMSASFFSSRFHTTYHLPTYQAWLEAQDVRPGYAFHRRFLQHLQWRAPGARWVLKAPSHLWAFDALFETYPDALVVQTHRDPLTVLPSVASLTAVLQAAFARDLDMAEIGAEVTHRWAGGLERGLHFRRSGQVPAERFVDIHYHELVRDPLATIQRIYRHFDLPFTPRAEAAMRAHLADNPKDKHGAHRYTLEAFGLDAETLSDRFKGYREFFAIRPEGAAPTGS